MERPGYASDVWAAQHEKVLCGNDRTTLLFTPSTATTTGQTTMSVTGKHESFGRAVKLKRLLYLVDTATTAGDATTSKLSLVINRNTTGTATMAVTTQAALAVVTSSELDIDVDAADYIRIVGHNISTGSDKTSAIGMMALVYEERFTNV